MTSVSNALSTDCLNVGKTLPLRHFMVKNSKGMI